MGHIDLLDTISYFEVPEKDARKVMTQLTGIRFKGRQVRCNDADEDGKVEQTRRNDASRRPRQQERPSKKRDFAGKNGNWRDLMAKVPRELKGDEPDFSEEGWARRKPKKKR